MRLGLYLSPQHPAADDLHARLAEHLDQVRLARELGFTAVVVPQHFLSAPYAMLHPIPLLGRLAAEAGEMRLGTGVLLLPLLNPVDVAEMAATLDVITGGRLVIGIGQGYRGEEDRALGLAGRRAQVLADKLRVVGDLLSGETVTAEGPGYRLRGARLALRPLQRPRPPIWLAANSDAAVLRAASSADTWLINPHAAVSEIERQLALFHGARSGAPQELPIIREALVGRTDAEALELARPHLAAKYATYVRWGQSEAMPPGDTLRRGWDDLRAGRFILGSPATAARQLQELRDRLGVTLVLVRVQWPGLPHAVACRTLRLLAEEVA